MIPGAFGFVLLFSGWSPVDRNEAPAGEPSRLNFIVILADDLGWTDLGCCGSDYYLTPNLDKLSSDGVRFDTAYAACTVCSPTRAALMTGKYPARLRITDWIAGHRRPFAKLAVPDWTMYLPREETTIAELLSQAGYATAAIGKWHLGNQKQGYPTRHGFAINLGGNDKGQPPSYFSPYGIDTLADGPDGEYLTDRTADEAIRFLKDNTDRPFFLYLPFHAVHTPIQAKTELVESFRRRATRGKHNHAGYAAMIASLDEAVGRILKSLDDLKLADRTVIVFTSDNGGLIGSTDNGPLRAGKGSAYEGGVRVPLIIKQPGGAKGKVCHTPVITMDLFATLCELAGVKAPGTCDGVSLVPLLRRPNADLERDALFWHYPHYHPGGATPYGAIRSGDWRLIEFYEDMRVELYHLRIDPSEQRNLAEAKRDKTEELRDRLHRWRESVQAQMPTPNPQFDPEKDAKGKTAKKGTEKKDKSGGSKAKAKSASKN